MVTFKTKLLICGAKEGGGQKQEGQRGERQRESEAEAGWREREREGERVKESE